MLFYFDVIMGFERVRDLDGGEMRDAESARTEAGNILVEVVVEELRNGKKVGADWRIEIFDEQRSPVASVLLKNIILEPRIDNRSAGRHLHGSSSERELREKFQDNLLQTRGMWEHARALLGEIQQSLEQISEVSARTGKQSSPS
jgi:hypothetical protein